MFNAYRLQRYRNSFRDDLCGAKHNSIRIVEIAQALNECLRRCISVACIHFKLIWNAVFKSFTASVWRLQKELYVMRRHKSYIHVYEEPCTILGHSYMSTCPLFRSARSRSPSSPSVHPSPLGHSTQNWSIASSRILTPTQLILRPPGLDLNDPASLAYHSGNQSDSMQSSWISWSPALGFRVTLYKCEFWLTMRLNY